MHASCHVPRTLNAGATGWIDDVALHDAQYY